MKMHLVNSCYMAYDILTNSWKIAKFLKHIHDSQQNLSHKHISTKVLWMPHIWKFIYLYVCACVYVCICYSMCATWQFAGVGSHFLPRESRGLNSVPQMWGQGLLSAEPFCHLTQVPGLNSGPQTWGKDCYPQSHLVIPRCYFIVVLWLYKNLQQCLWPGSVRHGVFPLFFAQWSQFLTTLALSIPFLTIIKIPGSRTAVSCVP